MTTARFNDPSQLTVFDPLPSDFDLPKNESIFGKVLRKVTGSQIRLSSRASPNSSRRSSVSDVAPLSLISERLNSDASIELHRASDGISRRGEEPSSSSLFSPGGPRTLSANNHIGTPLDYLDELHEDGTVGFTTRTLGSVLQHLKAIAAGGSDKDLQPFRDGDFKHFWVPDSLSRECYECGEKFTTFRRRRHCRVCGQIFCGRCADQEVPGHLLGYSGSLRMCTFCSQVVLSRTRYFDPISAVVRNSSVTQEKQRNGASLVSSPSRSSGMSEQSRYQLFSGQPQDGATDQNVLPSRKLSDELRGLTCDQLREIWLEMNHVTDGLELKIHRHRFRAFPDCVSGVEIVDWLLRRAKTATRKQAVRIGQGLLNFKFLECLTTGDAVFVDEYVLYKPKTVTNELEDASILTSSDFVDLNEEPTWLKDIEQPDDRLPSQSAQLHLDSMDEYPDVEELYFNSFASEKGKNSMRRTDSNVSISSQLADSAFTLPSTSSHQSSPITQISEEMAFRNVPQLELWRNSDHHLSQPIAEATSEISGQPLLEDLFQVKLHALLRQLEAWEDLDGQWHDLILSLSAKITEQVAPSIRENHDDMDVRQFVHVKTVAGGKGSDSAVVWGVVCSKHVAHRKMRQSFVNPKILLYGAALDFQKAEDKFSSLEPVMQEEAEFLKKCVLSISEFQPDILLVERNVSRLAQDYLFEEGVTLVANVKPSIMDRISRCTGADKFSLSAENLITQPRLGTCSKFDVKTVDLKPYMTFDGCPKQLGCTVLLRGGTKQVLRKVKKILTFIVYCQYNWRLEKAFLTDEYAWTPENSPEVHDTLDLTWGFLGIMSKFISSVSPLVQPTVPFLLTDVGRVSANRLRLPETLFWSKLMEISVQTELLEKPSTPFVDGPEKAELLPAHPLLSMHLTEKASSPEVQRALASFRARGGRLEQAILRGDVAPLQPLKSPAKSGDIVDCFDVYRHQRLPILCSIHACEAADVMASFCVFPWILVINFYGKNDLTLGDYLETFCFRLDAHCPNQQCGRAVNEHVRRFASGDAAISVTIRDLENSSAPPLTEIVTWTWCRICREISPVIPLSSASWSMSFAKYLDLRLHASNYHRQSPSKKCNHSLHRDHVQYFAVGQTVAAFKLSLVKLREIASPSIVITIDDSKSLSDRQDLIEMTKIVAIKGYNIFATIADYLTTCHSLELEKLEDKLATLLAAKRSEKQMFKDWLECLQLKLASPLLKFETTSLSEADQLRDFIWDIEDSINTLKRKITETAITWSNHLGEVETVKRKEERKHVHNLKSFQSTPEFVQQEDMMPMPCMVSVLIDPASDTDTSYEPAARFLLGVEESDTLGEESNLNGDFTSSPRSETSHLRHSMTSVGPLANTTSTDASYRDGVDGSTSRSVSRQKSMQISGASNIVPYPFPPNEHYVLGESDGIPVVVYDDELSSMIAFALSSSDYASQLVQLNRPYRKEPRSSRNVSGESTNQTFGSDSPASHNASTEASSSTMAFLRDAAEGTAPFYHVEHSMFGPNSDGPEADSLEALSKQSEQATAARPKSANKPAPEPKHYIEVQFGDQVAKFYCRIYFPEEFRLFRAMVFPYGEDRFIRSLSRSVAWKAAGGKSGSTFSKTADGRFVLKQMSRLEVQSFMEFAPHYFIFMAQSAKEKRPTVIAKVVGVYRIGFKNSLTGAQVKQDLLVMENVFYGRKMQQVYDLKGSLRNRLASTNTSSADAELVLLDENFLKRICDNPLYIRPHAKSFLRKALQTDTQFLAGLYVMDYSLLVGIDDESKEIAVGIIDYIRTFTWDKRLEMVVKSTGLLGGQKILPTIVSPELYRSRFCEAMERYFLAVPDEWYGLGRFADGI